MKLTKKDVQKRVSQNGKPLAPSKFRWDPKTKTFSTNEANLVIDFNTSYGCTFKTGSRCTFDTGSGCTFDAGNDCTFDTGHDCKFDAGNNCTFKTGYNCTFKTGSRCTFKTGSRCTFKTGSSCTFKTGFGCTFDTGSDCTFKTGSSCTFKTGFGCTFDTGSSCTFKTDNKSVVIRRDEFEIIECDGNKIIKLCPFEISGYLSKDRDGNKWYLNGNESLGEYVIVDEILSKVVSRKGNVLKVINHEQTRQSYIVLDGDIAAHGDTIKEAKESLVYKIGEIDTREFEGLDIDEQRPLKDIIRMYRAITGACTSGTRYFVEQQKEVKETYSIKEIIEITEGQYGNNKFKEFFNK
jgi:hypothetical protein